MLHLTSSTRMLSGSAARASMHCEQPQQRSRAVGSRCKRWQGRCLRDAHPGIINAHNVVTDSSGGCQLPHFCNIVTVQCFAVQHSRVICIVEQVTEENDCALLRPVTARVA
jgi:hypothetical protein